MTLANLPSDVTVRPLRPQYFTERDQPWLQAILDERSRFVGRKRAEWQERLGEGAPFDAPRSRLLVVLAVLDRLAPDSVCGSMPAPTIRATLFRAAACLEDRGKALANAAATLGLSVQQVEDDLFADLRGQRLLSELSTISPEQLALRCNAELVARLLGRALRVRVTASGRVRAVVQHAKLTGLLCLAYRGSAVDEVRLDISGPFALFRQTRLYARALSTLLSRLTWCRTFRLEADCVLGKGDRIGRLVLQPGDPVLPARELRAFDSKVEERFAKSFAKLAPAWQLEREPVAMTVGTSLFFPDFALRHRATGERWLLEIVGYWTREYLEKKLALLRALQPERLLICIDERLCCGTVVRDLGPHVLLYNRTLDARAVLAKLDPVAYAALSRSKPRRSKRKPLGLDV